MEQQTKAELPSNKLGISLGFATGLSMVFYNLILKMIKVPDGSWMNFMVLVIFLLGILWFCYTYSKNEDNDTSFGGMFKACFRMVAIVTIVLVAYSLCSVYMDPSIKQKAMAMQTAELVKEKKNPSEIKILMDQFNDRFTIALLMNVVYTNIFQGVIFTLIGAAIFRKNKV